MIFIILAILFALMGYFRFVKDKNIEKTIDRLYMCSISSLTMLIVTTILASLFITVSVDPVREEELFRLSELSDDVYVEETNGIITYNTISDDGIEEHEIDDGVVLFKDFDSNIVKVEWSTYKYPNWLILITIFHNNVNERINPVYTFYVDEESILVG